MSFESAADPALLVIDVLDEEAGLADVEDSAGRTFQLPAEWLPGAADGAAYRVEGRAGQVTFTPDPGGARQLRERSKQTLLEFVDEFGADESDPDGPGPDGSGKRR
ncbi:hypothetical protein SAMN04488058_1357 [Deinococcus reticulitermitis]|uniref:DUF3006 domain-containing protein n=1 Tax=Deinococcus reticulitermitis TaxID=856736 RepID=A0A1H7CPF1_9DEIO|nr:hypothetical protein [Deinococcus reticulitermitis]SEJ91336.1 hypothetical protein SAMN04488058_1357 [Deinococcus reticulitermitis]